MRSSLDERSPATDRDDMIGFDPSQSALQGFIKMAVLFGLPGIGALFALVASSAMCDRVQYDDPDNPIAQSGGNYRAYKRHRTEMILTYIDMQGLDANVVAYVVGMALAVGGFLFFSRIDAALDRLLPLLI